MIFTVLKCVASWPEHKLSYGKDHGSMMRRGP